ncbi:MAG: thioesterase [Cycloclasticus sp. symbiont of Bathymodiolus heckerae]|nr:MAG: thioesterase [Cycloclasticus sp. symbiont of Bathymodiolus heckerae]
MVTNAHLEKINQTPHAKKLNLELLSSERTSVILKLPFNEELIGDPVNGYIHGGAITTLADTACGVAIFQAQNNYRAMATLDLRIDHMQPASSGSDVYANADCYHLTHTIAFVRVNLYTDDASKPIATATGSFMRSNEEFPVN